MKTWKLKDVQTRFREMVELCINEPQMVCDHNTPVAVIINVDLFKQLTNSNMNRTTIASLLDELEQIKKEEICDIEIR
ncbi:MAG: type II toxin-antitoxin system Phd/YefM family antitoxin [Desulfobacterales bacterium]|nr:type II toxin-antitoxin system Phd/YefM family antitoxin [Desulfobacterales bacterium]